MGTYNNSKYLDGKKLKNGVPLGETEKGGHYANLLYFFLIIIEIVV